MGKKIDMFAKSRRKKWSRACRIYANHIATQWLGKGAFHVCDDGCWHNEACDGCIFQDEEMCFIEQEMSMGNSMTEAHKVALEAVR